MSFRRLSTCLDEMGGFVSFCAAEVALFPFLSIVGGVYLLIRAFEDLEFSLGWDGLNFSGFIIGEYYSLGYCTVKGMLKSL